MAIGSFSQGLIINGGNVIMNGGVYVVINRQANDGITRTAGGIINRDENQNNYISWIIKNGASNDYTIPWLSSGSVYIPFKYHINTAGSNDGSLFFSTWQTQSNNSTPIVAGGSGKPTGVLNMNSTSGLDNSLFCADRFWWIKNFASYTTKPTSTLTFGYVDPTEFAAPNTITESDLRAQYWSSSWVLLPSGMDVPASNWVNTIPGQTFDAPWVLVSKLSPLPIELLSFNAICLPTGKAGEGGKVNLNWVTASETNNDYFTIERSKDAQTWETVTTIPGAGNSNTTLYYDTTDNQPFPDYTYYRLKQTDYNGTFKYSNVVLASCSSNNIPFNLISVNPNLHGGSIVLSFTANEGEQYTYALYDVLGKLLQNKSEKAVAGMNEVHISTQNTSEGIYIVTLQNATKYFGRKIFLSDQY